MSRDGYYGDFDSFADEQRAYEEQEQAAAEQDAAAEEAESQQYGEEG